MEIRTDFHKKLQEIHHDILFMGSMVEKAILSSVKALKERDLGLAERIVADDTNINAKRFEIENKCIQLIVTQQPMASDMRVIMAVVNIITELERIGDYAEGIEYDGVTFRRLLYPVLTVRQFVEYPLWVFAFTTLVGLYPARYAAKMLPSTAMRRSL